MLWEVTMDWGFEGRLQGGGETWGEREGKMGVGKWRGQSTLGASVHKPQRGYMNLPFWMRLCIGEGKNIRLASKAEC